MFAKLQMELETEKKERLTYQKAVLLQGVLMEHVKPEYAVKMHESALHPYSQWIVSHNDRNQWNICTTNEEAFQQMIVPLLDTSFSEFTLEHGNQKIAIRNKNVSQMDSARFMEEFYFQTAERYIPLCFETPTAFKQDGAYVYIPDLALIYQSLMNKYDSASSDDMVKNEEALEHLVQYSRIVQYNVRSTWYSVNGIRIPAFLGTIVIKVNGPQTMVNFANFLFRFGEYAGVGIKTAMGMGSIRIAERRSA